MAVRRVEMATKHLERLVIAYFDDNDVAYQVEQDDIISVTLPTRHSHASLRVIDHAPALPLIEVAVFYFARFPDDQRVEALELVNQTSMSVPGSVSIDDDGDVSYIYDWVPAAGATPDDFGTVLAIALAAYSECFPEIMAARWRDGPGGEEPDPEE